MAHRKIAIDFLPVDRERIESFRKTAGGGMSAASLVRIVMKNWLDDVDKRKKEFEAILNIDHPQQDLSTTEAVGDSAE